VFYPSKEEVAFAEKDREASAEYEEELREEESFITPGETSEEDDLELQRRKSDYKKEREASAEHEFENGEIPYEVAYTEYVEDLREKLLIPSKEEVAYAEYEEELREEEREEESFITPDEEFEYAEYEAEYEYEYAEYVEDLRAVLQYFNTEKHILRMRWHLKGKKQKNPSVRQERHWYIYCIYIYICIYAHTFTCI
jgi:hypothetical protein